MGSRSVRARQPGRSWPAGWRALVIAYSGRDERGRVAVDRERARPTSAAPRTPRRGTRWPGAFERRRRRSGAARWARRTSARATSHRWRDRRPPPRARRLLRWTLTRHRATVQDTPHGRWGATHCSHSASAAADSGATSRGANPGSGADRRRRRPGQDSSPSTHRGVPGRPADRRPCDRRAAASAPTEALSGRETGEQVAGPPAISPATDTACAASSSGGARDWRASIDRALQDVLGLGEGGRRGRGATASAYDRVAPCAGWTGARHGLATPPGPVSPRVTPSLRGARSGWRYAWSLDGPPMATRRAGVERLGAGRVTAVPPVTVRRWAPAGDSRGGAGSVAGLRDGTIYGSDQHLAREAAGLGEAQRLGGLLEREASRDLRRDRAVAHQRRTRGSRSSRSCARKRARRKRWPAQRLKNVALRPFGRTFQTGSLREQLEHRQLRVARDVAGRRGAVGDERAAATSARSR